MDDITDMLMGMLGDKQLPQGECHILMKNQDKHWILAVTQVYPNWLEAQKQIDIFHNLFGGLFEYKIVAG